MIDYTPFWNTIKERGISTYALIQKENVNNGTLYRMRKQKPLSTTTLDDLCRILHCRIEDIVRYVPDKNDEG
ncbi:MAG: helix-turn-helix transcriptional regulator [Clostridiales bacterium]|nr:helix-turn-helix transcriptional regulator [Clostridiales bacterium]